MSGLQQVLILAAVGVVATTLLGRLRLPIVAGLLVAGALAGPHGLGLVADPTSVEESAEIGVVLLLFTIGLEFSLARLARIRRFVLLGGALQVGLTVALAAGLVIITGGGPRRGIFFGFLLALSSTAIVLRSLQDRGETDTSHGRFVIGALIFQDLCVIPMMLLVPVLAGAGGGATTRRVLLALLEGAAVVAAAAVLSRLIVPRFLELVDRARSREVFLLAIVVACAGTAYATSRAGLSPALGAFIAGMVLAESDFAHRALAEVLPLRDLFASLFFLSVGMLFDVRVVVGRPAATLGLLAALVLGKALIATIAAIAMPLAPRVAVLAGLGLAQFGEFGFILLHEGVKTGLLTSTGEQLVLAAGVLSMLLTPIAFLVGPRVAALAGRLTILDRALRSPELPEAGGELAALADHVVVVGYGVAGRVVAMALRDSGIPHVVFELSVDGVRRARREGVAAYYGDIANPETIATAGVARARALVVLINDPEAAMRAVAAARHHAPSTPIFSRTRYLAMVPRMREMGATEAVAEEVEGGLEVLARILRQFGTPRNVLADRIREAREATVESARDIVVPRHRLGALPELEELKIESFLVREGMHAVGRSVIDVHLRTRSGALVVTARRDGKLLDQPDPHQAICAGDVLYLVGPGDALARAFEILETGRVGDEPPARDGARAMD